MPRGPRLRCAPPLREDLIGGRIPLAAERLGFELELLAEESVEGSGAGALSPSEQARVDALIAGTHARTVVDDTGSRLSASGPVTTALVALDDGSMAVLDGAARSGRMFPLGALVADLEAAWQELLPDHGAFLLLSPNPLSDGENPSGDAVGVPAVPAGMAPGWELRLVDPGHYAHAFARRQQLLQVASFLLAAGLVAVAFAGRRMLLRQAELERMRSDFLAGVSHELRTPAASLVLLADNLAAGRVTGAERQAEYFTALRQDAERLRRLVDDVLDVSRLEQGELVVTPEPVEPGLLLRRLVADQRGRLADAGLELELEMPVELPIVALDAGSFERAVANLLENARKYATAGTRVLVTATATAAELRVVVEDDGPGVPEAWRERVFERWARGPDSDPLAAGAGLGLALVRETLLAHGGDALLEQVDPHGARFVLRLPLDAESAQPEGGGA